LAALLKPLIGARLQEIETTDTDLVLGFYSFGELLWLWIDMNATRPCLLPWSELPFRVNGKKTPLNLFLRAHFRDRVLREVERSRAQGRVIHFYFGEAELEVRLFPHGRNIVARAEGKSLSWQKQKDLPEAKPSEDEPFHLLPPRPLDALREEWCASRKERRTSKSGDDVKERLLSESRRNLKAIAKVEEELDRKRQMPWRALGDWMKANQSLDVPKEWEPFVDKRRKLSWNIEQAYGRARDVETKIFGTERRLEILREELHKLESLKSEPVARLPAEPERLPRQPLKNLDVSARTLKLNERVSVLAGKNAADNLKLLRKARPWDLWLHLRDFPSQHAIVFRNKGEKINDATLGKISEWFVRQHFGAKYGQHAGERLEILVAECRHVRPIKGDRIGRVTYQNERVLIFKIPS
jgi:predicted ribosome quality control (RQC) complex YloA/Tae2 family protein